MPPTRARRRPARCPRTHCKTKKAHDTYSAYRYGCRSDAAIADRHRYEKECRVGLALRRRLPAGPYTRRLRCLAAIGWDAPRLAPEIEMDVKVINRLRHGVECATVTQATARRVDAGFRRLWDTPPPPGLLTDRAIALAARRDWYPAAAYDDLDDMTEAPKPGHQCLTNIDYGDATARRTEVARRHSTGQKAEGIARDMGIAQRTVERHLATLAAAQQQEAAS